MESFLQPQEKKKKVNVVFLVGIVIGALLLAGGIYWLTRQPSMEDQMASILEGSYREGSPEFQAITKDIIISTSDKTVESPTALGIAMFITGTIRNKGDKVINGLEVNVAVVTQFNQVLQEKRVLVVPTQRPQLGPGETIDITLSMAGFKKEDDRANIRWKVTAIRVAN